MKVGYGVGLWKALRKEWDLVACKILLVVAIGGGCFLRKTSVRFDALDCGVSHFMCYCWFQHVVVRDVCNVDEGGLRRVLETTFSRPFNDLELEEVNNLLLRFSHEKVQPSLEDSWIGSYG